MFSTNVYEKFAFPISESVRTTLIVCIVFQAICAIVSISGNMLVFWVYGKRVSNRARPSDLLILNLAVADFAVGLILLPLMIVTDVFILCRQLLFLRAVLESSVMPFFASVSIWTVFGASIDRFVAIGWPHEYSSIVSRPRVIKWIIFTWMYCSTWIWFPFLPGVIGKYLLMIRAFVGFCVAMAIIYCWISIYSELRRAKKIHDVQNAARDSKSWHSGVKRKVAKMFFCVVISLYSCYIPLWIRAMAYGFNALNSSEYEIFAISLVLANSSVNPIIYSFTRKIFRDELFGRKLTLTSKLENANSQERKPIQPIKLEEPRHGVVFY